MDCNAGGSIKMITDNKLKKIYILATGGTIAGKGDTGKTSAYKAGELDFKELLSTIPSISHKANIYGEQILNVDSNEITTKDWIMLANKINKLAKDDIEGFVITHGTDTLDETAYFLNLVVKTNKPVVITGAMRPATAASADGPLNLYQAIALASSDAARGHGILVAFSDGIYSGRDVQKVNTFKTDAFNEKDFACLGCMRDDECYFFTKTLKTHTVNSIFSVENIDRLPKVGVAYFGLGSDENILDYLAEKYEGIVIAGSGCGDYSEKWIKKVQSLNKKGIPVVRSSRIGRGIITENPIMDRSENSIPSNTLSPQKARILLSLALTKTKDFQEIKQIFKQY